MPATASTQVLRRRAALGVGPEEPVFGTVDGGFREPRTVSRWLFQIREASAMEWVTTHTWRKTTASVLDGSGITARMIADQLSFAGVDDAGRVPWAGRRGPSRRAGPGGGRPQPWI